uniref:Uncharacterized protein n=1 Tax=Strombidinopsis acuminata TaxID=141414 RepID=A0A7S3RSV5_9SPIT|mmetsp:Transcript_44873/g.116255  ORF Transcript_44873/g.116255 Transcript_44873/m.116255 type:complete len:358 (-) Transcript_44873:104-1177(-)
MTAPVGRLVDLVNKGITSVASGGPAPCVAIEGDAGTPPSSHYSPESRAIHAENGGHDREGCVGIVATAPSPTGGPMMSLNSDPYNLRAEELALQECTLGLEIRRTWQEPEMVRSFDGRHFPGTPDGMFETWDGALTCVQVVRVPLLLEYGLSSLKETLAQTVLTKVVKSQQWLSASHIVPQDFVIFCWLPFAIPEDVSEHAETLMQRVRKLDPRFSLRLRLPAKAGALFPAMFATSARERRKILESDVSTYTGSEDGDDDDELLPWDITWGWDQELEEPPQDAPEVGAGEGCSRDESDGEEAWDVFSLTWPDVDLGCLDTRLSDDASDPEFEDGESHAEDNMYITEVQQISIWDDGG